MRAFERTFEPMSFQISQNALRCLSTAAGAVLLTGCAALQGPAAGADTKVATSAPSAAAAPASAASGAARPDPAAPKPFAEIIKGARVDDGFVPVWRKDDKVWLEIAPERLNQPFYLAANVSNSVGERGLYASSMGPAWTAEFRLIGSTSVQLIALNTEFRAERNPAMQRTVKQSFSDSLLGAGKVVSAPHPKRKSVLIDASFLLADLRGLGTSIEAAFRLPFALDKGNSYIDTVRASPRATSLTAQLHFATARIPAPPQTPPPPGAPKSEPPKATPDPRSFFIGMVVNFTALPDKLMAPRLADARLGHFTNSFVDLSDDLKAINKVHYVKRWRLEKKDPAAAVSEPVKPITFWLDRNIPAQYRAAVSAGILEWNKAFEKAGFTNAIVAKQQPDDADFDTMDGEHASIRWFTGADVGFARGPSHSDQRSGEILDADIQMSDVFGRGARRFIREDVAGALAAHRLDGHDDHEAAFCTYALESAQEMNFALDLLEARGDIAPDSPEAEAFVQAQIKDTIMHEVGHTLGLKHNFRSSTVITRAQLQDKAFTESNAISGSVMDYTPYNIPLAGEAKGNLNVTTLGPYDYWAIEYAYRQIEPAQEATELAKIAARSTEPQLAFADDADAGGFGGLAGLDPRDNRFDLGDDPLAYSKKRLALSRELWARMQQRGPKVGDDALRLRRSITSGFRQLGRAPEFAAKYVGGMYTERDPAGPGARPAYRPVEPERQREALQFLTSGLFSIDSFRFKPEFLTSVGPDYIEWERSAPLSIPDAVLSLQTQAMNRLMDSGAARRLLELPYYLPEAERKGAISLNEVYATLQSAVWAELKTGGEIDALRRNLQREHLKRVQQLLTKGAPGLPADALSLARLQAGELQAALRKAVGQRGLSVETRAHLQDSLGSLTEALRATMQRS